MVLPSFTENLDGPVEIWCSWSVTRLFFQPGATILKIADEVYRRLEQIKKDLPEDIRFWVSGLTPPSTSANPLRKSTKTIYVALPGGAHHFPVLRDWRTTIIPVIMSSRSLIGSLFIMYIAGFSINVPTLARALYLPIHWSSTTPLLYWRIFMPR